MSLLHIQELAYLIRHEFKMLEVLQNFQKCTAKLSFNSFQQSKFLAFTWSSINTLTNQNYIGESMILDLSLVRHTTLYQPVQFAFVSLIFKVFG